MVMWSRAAAAAAGRNKCENAVDLGLWLWTISGKYSYFEHEIHDFERDSMKLNMKTMLANDWRIDSMVKV